MLGVVLLLSLILFVLNAQKVISIPTRVILAPIFAFLLLIAVALIGAALYMGFIFLSYLILTH